MPRKPSLMALFSKAQPTDSGGGSSNSMPLDVVYACSVCSATFSETYNGHTTTMQNLSDGINPRDRIVTRLYLTSCCHVICSKHFEGGGPAFHPAGQRPRAQCPVCIAEKGEHRERDLYSVRGFRDGEYDPAIPKAFFMVPPVKLEGGGKDMEALRFQYLALARYSKNITAAHQESKQQLKQTAESLEKAVQDLTDCKATALSLRGQVQSLEQGSEQFRRRYERLRRFEKKIPLTTHYLNIFPKIVEQNKQLNQRLACAGLEMPLEPIDFKPPFEVDDNGNMIREHTEAEELCPQKTSSSRTAGGSVHTPGAAEEAITFSSPRDHRPFKRMRTEAPIQGAHINSPTSRDAMPPPPKPVSKMKSMRSKIFTSLRRKNGPEHGLPPPDMPAPSEDVHMSGNEHWKQVEVPPEPSSDYHHSSTSHEYQDESPYMSGALPSDYSHRANMQPQLLSSLGIQTGQTEFKFRSPSPIKMSPEMPIGLPSEPSYMRLMDGLSRDIVPKLQLQDPRQSSPLKYGCVRQQDSAPSLQHDVNQHEGSHKSNHFSFGNSLRMQSRRAASPSTRPLTKTPNTNLTDIRPSTRNMSDPVTPAARRNQQPMPRQESVVSPFFKSDRQHSYTRWSVFTRPDITEPRGSSIHSDAYRLPNPNAVEAKRDWYMPHSLNGLSFFDSPVITRNEYSEFKDENRRLENAGPYHSRHLDSRGFVTRPDTIQGICLRDDVGEHDARPYPLHSQMYHKSTADFKRSGRSSQSRVARLPSAAPSIVSGRTSYRTQSAWENLKFAGVKSSQALQNHSPNTSYVSPAKNIFSNFGRRSVRR